MTLQELKNDPMTKGRTMIASIRCLDNGITDIETIFSEIDKEYSIGKHKSPSYIKSKKKDAIKFLTKYKFL